MPHQELLERIRELTESLRGRTPALDTGDLLQRLEQAMALGEEAAQHLASATPDSGFLHLPEGAAAPGEDLSRLIEERDMLRANVLALQQERDFLRQKVQELEDRLRESASHAADATDPTGSGESSAGISLTTIEAYDPSGHKKRMGEILVEAGVLSAEQLQAILAEQGDSRHKRLGALLVERGITTEEVIAKILAAQLKLPYVDLQAVSIVEAAALQVPRDMARRYECIAIDGDLAQITLAMSNPMDLVAIENIEITTERRVFPAVAIPSAINAAIESVYSAVQ
jgi:hypothetical protein